MEIPLQVITDRTNELNRKLDLYYAEVCSKIEHTFTRKYILQSRSKASNDSFNRLIEAGVIRPAAAQRFFLNKKTEAYRFDYSAYMRFKNAPQISPSSRTTK